MKNAYLIVTGAVVFLCAGTAHAQYYSGQTPDWNFANQQRDQQEAMQRQMYEQNQQMEQMQEQQRQQEMQQQAQFNAMQQHQYDQQMQHEQQMNQINPSPPMNNPFAPR